MNHKKLRTTGLGLLTLSVWFFLWTNLLVKRHCSICTISQFPSFKKMKKDVLINHRYNRSVLSVCRDHVLSRFVACFLAPLLYFLHLVYGIMLMMQKQKTLLLLHILYKRIIHSKLSFFKKVEIFVLASLSLYFSR